MAELQYMPFYVADWLGDTQDLSPEAYMAYHRLLCAMWLSRSNSLPSDPRILRNRAGFTPQKWAHVWPQIEHFFFVEDGHIHQLRLDKVRSKARGKRESRVAAGRKGAAAKWRKTHDKGVGEANGKPHDIKTKTISKDIAKAISKDIGSHIFYLGDGSIVSAQTIQAIKDGKPWAQSRISANMASLMLGAGLVTRDELKAVGIET